MKHIRCWTILIFLAPAVAPGYTTATLTGRVYQEIYLDTDRDGTSVTLTETLVGQAVSNPGSSTDNAVPRFDGAGGQTLQNSGVTIDDSNNLSTYAQFSGGSLAISGASLLDGTLTLGNNLDLPNGAWLGLGATDGRFTFTSVGATDRLALSDADFGIGTAAPSYPLQVAGDMCMEGATVYLRHLAYPNTYLKYSTKQVELAANSYRMFYGLQSPTQSYASVNEGGLDIDFQIEGDTKPNLFTTDAVLESVGVDSPGSSYLFSLNNDADYYDAGSGWNHESRRAIKRDFSDLPTTGTLEHHGHTLRGAVDVLRALKPQFFQMKTKRRDYLTGEGLKTRAEALDYVSSKTISDDDGSTRAMRLRDLPTTITIREEGSGHWQFGFVADDAQEQGLSSGKGINDLTMIANLWRAAQALLERQDRLVAKQDLQQRQLDFIRQRCAAHGIDMTGFPQQ